MSDYLTKTEQYSRKPFQLEDLSKIVKLDHSANWSDMGAYKTSTALWWLQEKLRDIEAPKMLIITTRLGKGTYWKLTPIIQPTWELYNIQRKKISMVLGDDEIPIDIPLSAFAGKHPMLFVAHYDVFTKRKARRKKDEAEDVEQNEELQDLIDKYAKSPQGLLDDILSIEWDALIIDEAHRIKNRTTGWTKNVKRIKAKHRHAMTGTGFINRPDEVWSIFHFLYPRQYTSYWRFRERFCEEEVDLTGFRVIKGIKPENEEEFKRLVRSVGPRRTKREVFKNLPEPIFSPVEVELNATQQRMYDSIRDELHALDQKGLPLLAPNVLAALNRLRQICVATPEVVRDYFDEVAERRVQEVRLIEPSSKLDALMEILEGLEWDDERKDQVVVFSNFKDPIELAKKRFEKKGISYIHMEQKDNDRKRYEKWAIDFPKQDHQVFICTLQLGSESISLTSASTCVFLDRSWSPKDNEQGVSRVWRPGQENVANIIHINAKETVDERILATNATKVGWFNQIFN
jgi:SNF2 family DNA or RNA helicase